MLLFAESFLCLFLHDIFLLATGPDAALPPKDTPSVIELTPGMEVSSHRNLQTCILKDHTKLLKPHSSQLILFSVSPIGYTIMSHVFINIEFYIGFFKGCCKDLSCATKIMDTGSVEKKIAIGNIMRWYYVYPIPNIKRCNAIEHQIR